jgi:hypothetical protein
VSSKARDAIIVTPSATSRFFQVSSNRFFNADLAGWPMSPADSKLLGYMRLDPQNISVMIVDLVSQSQTLGRIRPDFIRLWPKSAGFHPMTAEFGRFTDFGAQIHAQIYYGRNSAGSQTGRNLAGCRMDP